LSVRRGAPRLAYLSANIVEDATGNAPAWAKPYTIVTVDGVDVGFVGLTTTSSSTSAHPKFVEGLSFTDPRAAVEKAGAEARAADADILLVLAHECIVPMVAALQNTEVRLDGILTGRCNDYGVTDLDLGVAHGHVQVGVGFALPTAHGDGDTVAGSPPGPGRRPTGSPTLG
jgi:hypothetical protein